MTFKIIVKINGFFCNNSEQFFQIIKLLYRHTFSQYSTFILLFPNLNYKYFTHLRKIVQILQYFFNTK